MTSSKDTDRSQRKQILEESASDTTIHGIPRTVGDRHPAVKALWLLAFIAFVGFLTRQFVMAVIKLRSLPVSTSIEPNSATFEFPDVHFCSQPMISASYPSTMGAEARNFTDAQTAKIVQLLDRFNASHPYFVAVALVNTLPTSFLSENFGMRKEQSIVKATVMPMNVELEFDKDIESFGHYKYLNCFRVRPKQNDIQRMLGNVLAYMDIFLYADATYNQSVKFYDGHIESRGLSFTGYENLLGSGFRVYFTPKHGYPDEFSPSVTIAPGYTHYIKLSMQVTNWAEKKGQCLSDQPNVQYVDLAKAEPGSYRYNLYACYAKELANIYATNLEANLPGMLPIPYSQKDLPNIYNFSQIGPNASDSEILKILVFMKKITNGQLTKETSQFMQEVQTICQNKYSCKEAVYKAKLSSIKSPLKKSLQSEFSQLLSASSVRLSGGNQSTPGRDWMIQLFNESASGSAAAEDAMIRAVSENFLRVQIQAGELSSTEVEQSISYKLFDLTVEVGGLISLFIGASLLSQLEIIELCVYMVLGRRPATVQADGS